MEAARAKRGIITNTGITDNSPTNERSQDKGSKNSTGGESQGHPQNELVVRKRVKPMAILIAGSIAAILAIVIGLLSNHGHQKIAIWLTYVSIQVILFPVFQTWAASYDRAAPNPPNENADQPEAKSKNAAPVVTPDFIPGTKSTHADLRSAFPFGYVIFSKHDSIQTYIPYPTDKLVWEADWNTIVITPNFSTGKVRLGIKRIIAYMPQIGKQKAFRIEEIGIPFDMTPGVVYPSRFAGPNQPDLHFGIIGPDQRKPVFVLGFAIVQGRPSGRK